VRIPIVGVRKIVADHLTHSRQTIPDATIWLDVDATELVRAKERLAESTGERYSVTALVARFVVAALRRFPMLNSSVDETVGEIVQHSAVNLGLAAQTGRGLMVPVVRDAHAMTLNQLRDAIAGLTEHARAGDYAPSVLTGGTFTLNNYGSLGVDGSSPIINHPEAAMLGVGRLMDRPWVVNGELAVRRVTTLSLVFDHRVCDGDVASGFITYVARCMQEPLLALTEL
jgi:pyruvate dehydrogenase E2 component (dihydrolipoamide acetyltransferase)